MFSPTSFILKLAHFTFSFLGVLVFSEGALAAPVDDLVRAMETQIQGQAFEADLTLTVTNSLGTRTLTAHVFNRDRKLALVKILSPEKDRNGGTLRVGLDLWQYLPNVDRVMKVPTSMMLQSWMGSDFSNDDLVKGTSLSRDYRHTLLKHEKTSGIAVSVIECLPLPNAKVVWGKVILRVREKDAVLLSQEFFGEDGQLIKTMQGSKVVTVGSHTIPSEIEVKMPRKSSMTRVVYEKIKFDHKIPDSIFTQVTLKRPSASLR